MEDTKILFGQAFISGSSLVQEQILLVLGHNPTSNTVSVIDDIWEDLKTEVGGGKYKTNGRGYFYWEVEMTDLSNDDLKHKIMVECPRPKEGFLTEPFDPDKETGEYAKYWATKAKIARQNQPFVARKEVLLKGTQWVDVDGKVQKIQDQTVEVDDVHDMTNLLGLF